MKSGMRVQVIPPVRMFTIVTTKLIAPASDETVRMCSARIQRSWPLPTDWTESGGYDVQPDFAAPPSAKKESRSTIPPKRKSQYDIAFRRGNAMSRAPIMSGTRKLPNPARIGTTTRNTIVVPCIVMTSLYESPVRTSPFACASCVRISMAITPPARKKRPDVTM